MSYSKAASVMKYLTDRPGQPCYRSEMADALGFTENAIRYSIHNIRNSASTYAKQNADYPGHHIYDIVRGNCWSYNPKGQPATPVEESKPVVKATKPKPNGKVKTDNIFIQIGTTTSGELILQSEDGELFKAVKL